MDLNQALRQLEEPIKTIASEQVTPTAADLSKSLEAMRLGSVMFTYADLGGLLLSDRDSNAYRHSVSEIQKAVSKKGERVSESEIESLVQRAILKSLNITGRDLESDISNRIRHSVSELRTELQTPPASWQIQLEILGLAPQGLPRRFGRCEFYFGDDSRVQIVTQRLELVANSIQRGTTRQEQARQGVMARVRECLLGKTCIETYVDAVDALAARNIAEKQVRLTLDILNFYANVLLTQLQHRLCLAGDELPARRWYVVSSEVRTEASVSDGRIGPLFPFSFDMIKPERLGYERISILLQKLKVSKLENRILAALQWAGRALVERRKEEAFLLFAISLEALLLKDEVASEITERFALRASYLAISKPEARIKAYRELKKLYGTRSKIVHAGNTRITDEELAKIRFFAETILLTMLSVSPFASMIEEAELEDWFETAIVGGTDYTLGRDIVNGPTEASSENDQSS